MKILSKRKLLLYAILFLAFNSYSQKAVGFNYKGEDTRPFLTCHQYSSSEVDSLEKAFEQTMLNAITVRQKAISAANFLATLKYAIPFAYESHIEGYDLVWKYTRKGLFLRDIVEDRRIYPAWGCEVTTPLDQKGKMKNLGDTYKVGFHCSSFVRWCLYNADAVTQNILEGTWANDFGKFPGSTAIKLPDGLQQIKPGDLMYFWVDKKNGHIAIVIGVDGDVVTFAESANWGDHKDPRNGVRWRTFNKKTTDYKTYRFKYLIKMDNVYKD